MPQPERTDKMSEILLWLNAKTKKNGASRAQLRQHTQLEITRLGATKRTCDAYLNDLLSLGLVDIGRAYRYHITADGIAWLKRHGFYTE